LVSAMPACCQLGSRAKSGGRTDPRRCVSILVSGFKLQHEIAGLHAWIHPGLEQSLAFAGPACPQGHGHAEARWPHGQATQERLRLRIAWNPAASYMSPSGVPVSGEDTSVPNPKRKGSLQSGSCRLISPAYTCGTLVVVAFAWFVHSPWLWIHADIVCTVMHMLSSFFPPLQLILENMLGRMVDRVHCRVDLCLPCSWCSRMVIIPS
jgi:hypothetical protein